MRLRSLISLLVTTLLASCGLFDTREPEHPITAGSGFEPATTPTLVLRNIESAFSYANASDYRKCFGDSARGTPAFVFQPSVQGMAASPEVFQNWGIVEEEEYVRNLFSELRDGAVASVSFTPSDVTGAPIGDSVRFAADYRARLPHTRTGVETEAAGTLEFTFRRSAQNEWVITYWRDISRSDQPSWSLIKARFIDR